MMFSMFQGEACGYLCSRAYFKTISKESFTVMTTVHPQVGTRPKTRGGVR